MSRWLLAALLSSLAAGCGDVGTVTMTCTSDYTDADGVHDTGDYPGDSLSCDDWADHGEQLEESTRQECVTAGFDAGATESNCTCTEDFGTCTFPHGVND